MALSKKVKRRFEDMGFEVELRGFGHVLLSKYGVSVITSQTPSCSRAFKNALSNWRHAYRRKFGKFPPKQKGKIT